MTNIKKKSVQSLIPSEVVENKILLIRSKKVMLDKDLAELYQVKTIALRQQVKRNADRFPEDFIFQLSKEEANTLVSQNVIPSKRSFSRALPYAFTEQGVAMLSSVLKSQRAAHVNIAIMRAFVKLREFVSTNKELARRLDLLEKKMETKDKEIRFIFEAVRQLINEADVTVNKPKKKIGFHT